METNSFFSAYLKKNKKKIIGKLAEGYRQDRMDELQKYSSYACLSGVTGIALGLFFAATPGFPLVPAVALMGINAFFAFGVISKEFKIEAEVRKLAKEEFERMYAFTSFMEDFAFGDGVVIGACTNDMPAMIIALAADFTSEPTVEVEVTEEKAAEERVIDLFDIQARNLEDYIRAFEYLGYEGDLDQLFGLIQGYAFEKDDPEFALVYYDALQELERVAIQKCSMCEEKGSARRRKDNKNARN